MEYWYTAIPPLLIIGNLGGVFRGAFRDRVGTRGGRLQTESVGMPHLSRYTSPSLHSPYGGISHGGSGGRARSAHLQFA